MTAAPPTRSVIIAVDGPAAAGKGTLARRLASHLGYAYLDTGSIYRAVARLVLDSGAVPEDNAAATAAARTLRPRDLDRPDLRDECTGQAASVVAGMPDVRAALLDFQRRFAEEPPAGHEGAILDGRDIGTVVCPDACIKLYVTASPEERARRRHKELLEAGVQSIYSRVLADVIARDERDSGRSVAPLRPADDAVVLDTTTLNAEDAFAEALRHVEACLRQPR